MSTSASEGEILTIKQVADYLKVTERTIYRLAAAKKIPAFKVGGTWRFSRADIDSWIKQQSMEGLASGRERGWRGQEQIERWGAKVMLGLTLREEFRGKRLKGTAIELSNDTNTGATQIAAKEFLEITYPDPRPAEGDRGGWPEPGASGRGDRRARPW